MAKEKRFEKIYKQDMGAMEIWVDTHFVTL